MLEECIEFGSPFWEIFPSIGIIGRLLWNTLCASKGLVINLTSV